MERVRLTHAHSQGTDVPLGDETKRQARYIRALVDTEEKEEVMYTNRLNKILEAKLNIDVRRKPVGRAPGVEFYQGNEYVQLRTSGIPMDFLSTLNKVSREQELRSIEEHIDSRRTLSLKRGPAYTMLSDEPVFKRRCVDSVSEEEKQEDDELVQTVLEREENDRAQQDIRFFKKLYNSPPAEEFLPDFRYERRDVADCPVLPKEFLDKQRVGFVEGAFPGTHPCIFSTAVVDAMGVKNIRRHFEVVSEVDMVAKRIELGCMFSVLCKQKPHESNPDGLIPGQAFFYPDEEITGKYRLRPCLECLNFLVNYGHQLACQMNMGFKRNINIFRVKVDEPGEFRREACIDESDRVLSVFGNYPIQCTAFLYPVTLEMENGKVVPAFVDAADNHFLLNRSRPVVSHSIEPFEWQCRRLDLDACRVDRLLRKEQKRHHSPLEVIFLPFFKMVEVIRTEKNLDSLKDWSLRRYRRMHPEDKISDSSEKSSIESFSRLVTFAVGSKPYARLCNMCFPVEMEKRQVKNFVYNRHPTTLEDATNYAIYWAVMMRLNLALHSLMKETSSQTRVRLLRAFINGHVKICNLIFDLWLNSNDNEDDRVFPSDEVLFREHDMAMKLNNPDLHYEIALEEFAFLEKKIHTESYSRSSPYQTINTKFEGLEMLACDFQQTLNYMHMFNDTLEHDCYGDELYWSFDVAERKKGFIAKAIEARVNVAFRLLHILLKRGDHIDLYNVTKKRRAGGPQKKFVDDSILRNLDVSESDGVFSACHNDPPPTNSKRSKRRFTHIVNEVRMPVSIVEELMSRTPFIPGPPTMENGNYHWKRVIFKEEDREAAYALKIFIAEHVELANYMINNNVFDDDELQNEVIEEKVNSRKDEDEDEEDHAERVENLVSPLQMYYPCYRLVPYQGSMENVVCQLFHSYGSSGDHRPIFQQMMSMVMNTSMHHDEFNDVVVPLLMKDRAMVRFLATVIRVSFSRMYKHANSFPSFDFLLKLGNWLSIRQLDVEVLEKWMTLFKPLVRYFLMEFVSHQIEHCPPLQAIMSATQEGFDGHLFSIRIMCDSIAITSDVEFLELLKRDTQDPQLWEKLNDVEVLIEYTHHALQVNKTSQGKEVEFWENKSMENYFPLVEPSIISLMYVKRHDYNRLHRLSKRCSQYQVLCNINKEFKSKPMRLHLLSLLRLNGRNGPSPFRRSLLESTTAFANRHMPPNEANKYEIFEHVLPYSVIEAVRCYVATTMWFEKVKWNVLIFFGVSEKTVESLCKYSENMETDTRETQHTIKFIDIQCVHDLCVVGVFADLMVQRHSARTMFIESREYINSCLQMCYNTHSLNFGDPIPPTTGTLVLDPRLSCMLSASKLAAIGATDMVQFVDRSFRGKFVCRRFSRDSKVGNSNKPSIISNAIVYSMVGYFFHLPWYTQSKKYRDQPGGRNGHGGIGSSVRNYNPETATGHGVLGAAFRHTQTGVSEWNIHNPLKFNKDKNVKPTASQERASKQKIAALAPCCGLIVDKVYYGTCENSEAFWCGQCPSAVNVKHLLRKCFGCFRSIPPDVLEGFSVSLYDPVVRSYVNFQTCDSCHYRLIQTQLGYGKPVDHVKSVWGNVRSRDVSRKPSNPQNT